MHKIYLPALVLIFSACKKTETVTAPPVIPVPINITVDSISINPSGYAPLTAIVNFSSAASGKTAIIVEGKHGDASNIRHVFNDAGYTHSVTVAGLYPNYLNTVLLRLIGNSGDTLARSTVTIQTGALPAKLPTSINMDLPLNQPVEEGMNLVSNFSAEDPYIPLMVDNYGDIRWLLDFSTHPVFKRLQYENGIKRLRNGNFYFADFNSYRICEVDLAGRIVHIWDLGSTPYAFHHDIYEKPNGNFVLSVSKTGSIRTDGAASIEDYIIEVDRESGNVLTEWDLKQSLNPSRFVLTGSKSDWIHVNSVLYDSTDNTIIVSGRMQGVVKLTYDNRVKWILAPHRGWGLNGRGEALDQFLLTPLAADGSRITDTAVLSGGVNHNDFEWCWHQHSVIQMPNGNLMLFDNGSVRNYNAAAPKYSRAVEFKIDGSNMTIQQKWQYGKERGMETFSSIVSSVQFLPNTNHVLFCPGFNVVNTNGRGGKIVEVDYASRQALSQLSISSANSWGFHRAKRMGLYP